MSDEEKKIQDSAEWDPEFEVFNLGADDIKVEIPNFEEINFDVQSRYSAPQRKPAIPDKYLLYEDAVKMAEKVNIGKDQRQFFILNGSFIFGDFIEAMVIKHALICKEMIISTLSMSHNNIDSLGNLLLTGWVDNLSLIVSDYWWSYKKGTIVPYLMKELDHDNKLQLAVTRIHTKMCQFETYDGRFFVIYGSANLLSSNNIEQITVEENKRLYYFMANFHKVLIERYKVIDKTIRQPEAWKLMKETHEKNKQ